MTTTIDFNDASGKQRSFDLIPEGTVAVVQISVRPGSAGADGWLKRASDGNSEALDCELKVNGGPHDGRKLWDLITVAGTTAGHEKAAEISRAKLCAILESARGIQPKDMSEAAQQARMITSYGEFDGLRFIAKIGIRKGSARPDGTGNYNDKNVVAEVITPDRKSWCKVEQLPPTSAVARSPSPPTSNGGPIARPQWSH